MLGHRFLSLQLDPEQPLAAQNRAQQGVVSILNYNVFLRPELVTDPDTVRPFLFFFFFFLCFLFCCRRFAVLSGEDTGRHVDMQVLPKFTQTS